MTIGFRKMDDPLRPARGVMNGMLFSIPIWFILIVLYFMLKTGGTDG